MHKTNIFRLLIFLVLIVLCSVGFSVRCFCASADETEQAMESPGTEDERTVNSAFIPGVYKIRNVAAYLSGRPCYLSDDTSDVLSLSMENSGREQLWLITPTGNYGKYQIVPLSKTTLDYSGTDYALFASVGDDVIIVHNMAGNYSTESEWGIYSSGVHYQICSNVCFEYDRHIFGWMGDYQDSLDLYYDEDIYDIENQVQWDMIRQSFVNITESDLQGFPELLSVFQTDNIDLKKYLSVRENVTDQRLVFRMNSTSCALLDSMGYLNVTNGNDIFTNSTTFSNRWITIEALNDETVAKEVEVSFKKINGSFVMWERASYPDEEKCITAHFNPNALSIEKPCDSSFQSFEISYVASVNRYTIRFSSKYLKANTTNSTVELGNTLDLKCYWALEDVFVNQQDEVFFSASFYYPYYPIGLNSTVQKYLYIDMNTDGYPLKLDLSKKDVFLTKTSDWDEYELQIQFLAVPITEDEMEMTDNQSIFIRSDPLGSVMYHLQQLGPYTLNGKNEEYTKDNVLTALEYGKFVIFRCHGSPGAISLISERVSGETVALNQDNNPNNDNDDILSSLEIYNHFSTHDGQLSNLDLLIFGSCESAVNGSGLHSNLVNVCSELGAKIVVGFTDTVNRRNVNEWISHFLPYYVNFTKTPVQLDRWNGCLDEEYDGINTLNDLAHGWVYGYIFIHESED